MNSTLQRYLAVLGMAAVTGTTLVGLSTPAAAVSTDNTSATRSSSDQGQLRHGRWIRLGEFDSRRECQWVGRRGENRGFWEDYRCVRDRRWQRDWVRDWDRDWDRDWGSGWHRGRWHDRDYRLWVYRTWR